MYGSCSNNAHYSAILSFMTYFSFDSNLGLLLLMKVFPVNFPSRVYFCVYRVFHWGDIVKKYQKWEVGHIGVGVVYRIGEGSQTFRKIWGKYEGHHVCKGGWFPEIGVALTYIGRCCSQKLRDILKKLIQRKFWHGMFYVVACSMESQKIHLIIVMIFSSEYSYWVALGLFSYRNITHNIALEKNELQIDELPYIMIEFSKNCLNIQAFQPSKNPSPRNVWNVETLE